MFCVEKTGSGAKVTFEPVKGGEATTIDADVVLIATGRKPYTEGLGLTEAKALVESAPKAIKEGVSKDEASKVQAQLVGAGAQVEVK